MSDNSVPPTNSDHFAHMTEAELRSVNGGKTWAEVRQQVINEEERESPTQPNADVAAELNFLRRLDAAIYYFNPEYRARRD